MKLTGVILLLFVLVACAQEYPLQPDNSTNTSAENVTPAAPKELTHVSPAQLWYNRDTFVDKEVLLTGKPILQNSRCTGQVCSPKNPCCAGCVADFGYQVNDTNFLPLVNTSGDLINCRGNNCGITCQPLQKDTNSRIKGVLRKNNEKYTVELVEIIDNNYPVPGFNDCMIGIQDMCKKNVSMPKRAITSIYPTCGNITVPDEQNMTLLNATGWTPCQGDDWPFETIAINPPLSNAFSHQKKENLVIRDEKAWRALFNDPYRLSKVNFSEEIVIAAFLGGQSSGGYAITITHVNISNEKKDIEVTVHVDTPPPNGGSTAVMTSPYHIVKIHWEGADLPVTFIMS